MYTCRLKRNQVVSREVLTKRHNVLGTTGYTKVESRVGSKVTSQMLMDSRVCLDCIEQEWEILYRQRATYTMRHISIEHHRTRENKCGKQEYVTDVIELVRRRDCP